MNLVWPGTTWCMVTHAASVLGAVVPRYKILSKKLDSVWVEVKIVTYHHDFRCGLRLIHLDPGRIWTWTSTQDQTFSRLTQFLWVSKIPSKSQQGWLSSSYAPPGPAKLCDQAWARWRWDPVSLHWRPLVSIVMSQPARVRVQTFYLKPFVMKRQKSWFVALRILIRYQSRAISDLKILFCAAFQYIGWSKSKYQGLLLTTPWSPMTCSTGQYLKPMIEIYLI